MKKLCTIIFVLSVLSVSGQNIENQSENKFEGLHPIYQSDAYTIYPNGVVQGKNEVACFGDSVVLSSFEKRSWHRNKDLSGYPSFSAPNTISNALYSMAVEELDNLIEADSTWRTGKWWGGVWTRDVSYSTFLALAYMQPDVTHISLMKKVANGMILEDTGTGGSWPCSTDRVVWAIAAWQLYLVTGDNDWLRQSYAIISKTLLQDAATVYDSATGLYRGESTFLDWREETYPRWMQPADISQSECLGTNALYFKSLSIASEMASLLKDPASAQQFAAMAQGVKEAINTHLWIEEKGYYGQYLYGRTHLILSPRSETLGESLCILFGIADSARAQRIVSSVALTPLGTPCIYPEIPNIYPYHNNAVWPFVQAYWTQASAVAGNAQSVNHGIAAIYRAAALFATNQENFVAANGDYHTAMNSPNMLWSIAGSLSIAHTLFAGIHFSTLGIEFHPFIPQEWSGTYRVNHFKYRKADLEIIVEGFGDGIKEFYLDGKRTFSPVFSASKKGRHTVRIVMNGSFSAPQKINEAPVVTSPETVPEVFLESTVRLAWRQVPDVARYKVLKDGKVIAIQEERIINANRLDIPDDNHYVEYQIVAIDGFGVEGFASEPLCCYDLDEQQLFDMTSFAPAVHFAPCKGWTGNGCVEIATSINNRIEMTVSVPAEGDYLVDFRYANGSGDLLGYNMCCNRTLIVNGSKAGQMVFPQRGLDLWQLWGWSNSKRVHLQKGENQLILNFGDENVNMNKDGINCAMLDQLRVIRLP